MHSSCVLQVVLFVFDVSGGVERKRDRTHKKTHDTNMRHVLSQNEQCGKCRASLQGRQVDWRSNLLTRATEFLGHMQEHMCPDSETSHCCREHVCPAVGDFSPQIDARTNAIECGEEACERVSRSLDVYKMAKKSRGTLQMFAMAKSGTSGAGGTQRADLRRKARGLRILTKKGFVASFGDSSSRGSNRRSSWRLPAWTTVARAQKAVCFYGPRSLQTGKIFGIWTVRSENAIWVYSARG